MTRPRKILLTVLLVIAIMATIHFTINGLPSLDSFNPHA